MPRVQSHGVSIYYEVHGSGSAVVFAHGMGGNAMSWWQQVPHFARRYRVISFDHRGFARSPCPAPEFLPGRFDPPDFALKLARKDVALACEVGREYDVPMRLAHMALAELTEAMNRGWESRDSRSAMLLQTERAGVEIAISEKRIREIIEQD